MKGIGDSMLNNEIRLDDLLTRSLRVQWFEGVALVQSVCRQVLGEGTSTDGFPEASGIRLGSDGCVSVSGPARGSGVTGAAHVLAQMLDDDVPVRLRLVVTQATGTANSHASLKEFSEALAYFERPDAQQVLRQLYERAIAAEPRAEKRPSPEPEQRESSQAVAPSPPPDAQRVSRRTILAITGALAVSATIALVGFGFGHAGINTAVAALKGFSRGTTESSSPGGEAKPAAESRSTQPDKKVEVSGTHEPVRSAHVERARSITGTERHSTPTTPVALSLPELSPLTRPDRRPGDWASTTTLARASTPIFYAREPIIIIASTDGDEPATELEGHLYSKEDSSVTPPRSVYPKLPPDSTNGAAAKGRTILEVIVATNGIVERVRLRTPPRDVHEFMLVSAAKAWQFEPATLAGRPVRFLLRVALTTP
jgi:hypothetical protein